MAGQSSQGVTADDILCKAKEVITRFGWMRLAWPPHGPAPRCTRAAIETAAKEFDVAGMPPHTDALRRVSEAIYRRGAVGGITEWEHKKSTNRDVVIAVLQKAIEMGPAEQPIAFRPV